MKNSTRIFAAIFICCLGTSFLTAATTDEIKKAISNGAKGKITFRVVDTKGNPVVGAQVGVGFYNQNMKGDGEGVSGKTDSFGMFTATGEPTGDMSYGITKEGYYKTEGSYWFYRASDTNTVKDGRWQPWNPTNTVVLKEIRHPVPMFARNLEIKMPVQNVPVAFDFEKGDWVAPYGKGITADMMIRYSNTNTGPGFLDFSRQLEMTFLNAADGILVLPFDGVSAFHSVYEAPESGYSPSLLIECDRTTYKVMKQVDLDANHYAIFRVRSVTNDTGQVVAANYGKIYGPIQYGILGGQTIRFEFYYFNPDGTRNLEFNTKSNLFLIPMYEKIKEFKTQARAKGQIMSVEDMNTESKMDKDRRDLEFQIGNFGP